MKNIKNRFSNLKNKLNINLNYDIVLPILFLVFVIGILFFITYKRVRISLADQLQTVHPERSRDSDDTHFASGQERWDINRRKAELKKEKSRRRFMDKGVYD